MTIEQVKAELVAFGQAVAVHLGPEWKVSYEELYGWKKVAQLRREDGATVMLHVVAGRVMVSGSYPQNYSSYYDKTREISVAVVRGPLIIAREIKSRFLVAYLAHYAKAVESLQRAAAFEAARQKALASLAAIVNEPLESANIDLSAQWMDDTREEPFRRTSLYVTVKLSSASCGEIEISSAPVALIAKVLQVIQEYRS